MCDALNRGAISTRLTEGGAMQHNGADVFGGGLRRFRLAPFHISSKRQRDKVIQIHRSCRKLFLLFFLNLNT
ncbi:hypothetical protein JOB18_024101 [Solea senegalensis]|uniref:Uncharacterized protein n=1 Tax=Solea senegalensis TaxID=28829 RepID=A0AAV6Q676_SOLSE|nr:hypothetical protein JOB18_024101 [Solea senegalensis]